VGVEAEGRAVDGEAQRSGGGVGPVLVGLAVAVVDLLLGAGRGGRVRVVQALARADRVQRAARAAAGGGPSPADAGLGDDLLRTGRPAGPADLDVVGQDIVVR